ncbi:MAG: hypothetical protein JWP87_1745 [Labilithrix sp.]|nr:hypothetical protein [Labilithrix sp.]
MLLRTDETDCRRRVDGPTLHHNHRKPHIPLPPALPLPAFSLPYEAKDEAVDPLDAAATAQRPVVTGVTGSRSRRSVRRRAAPVDPQSTSEVQLEDILLEVYADDPPPPSSRSAPPLPARASIAMAIASVVPAPPAQSAAVDALLRASDPAFAPYPPAQGMGYAHAADYESPSVAPVMLASTFPPEAGAPLARPMVVPRKSRAAVIAIWSALLLVISVAGGAAFVLGVRNGTYAQLRDRAKSVAAGTKHAPVAAASATTAPPPPAPAPVPPPRVASPSPSPSPSPAPMPTVSIDSLPKSPIAADSSLVTFPAYAQGHRVFLDGRVITVADGTPTPIKCGRHMLKIGSARKPRVLDFACGREVIVQ